MDYLKGIKKKLDSRNRNLSIESLKMTLNPFLILKVNETQILTVTLAAIEVGRGQIKNGHIGTLIIR